MYSQEIYEKTRKEVFRLLVAGESLPKEDVLMLRTFAGSNDPKGVLVCARGLKEEGNVFFKKGMFEEALDKYGYAELVVTCYEFGEKHRDEFFDLITSILLNFAACFNKKQVFDYVGLICTVILDFNLKQTKTLFRRAIATVEIGRKDLAIRDMELAYEIDPSNKEIRAKLDEVSSHSSLNSHKEHGQDTPISLSLGVPLLKKKKAGCFSNQVNKVNSSVEANQEVKICSLKEPIEGNGERRKVDSNDVEMSDVLNLTNLTENMANESLNGVKGGDHETTMNTDHDVVVEDVSKCSTVEKPYLAESEYRFVNRRKADSYLSFRGEMYQKLRVGKSLQYVNSKIGSYMTIKLLPKPSKCSQKNVKVGVVQMEEDVNYDPQENLSKEITENKIMEEGVDSEGSSNDIVEEVSKSVCLASPTQRDSQIFSKQDRKSQKAAGKKKKITNPQTLYGAKEHQIRKRNTGAGRTNFCACRYQLAGRKRSLVIPSSEACMGQSRKISRSVPVPIINNDSSHSSSLSRMQPGLDSRSGSSDVSTSMYCVSASPAFHEVVLATTNGG